MDRTVTLEKLISTLASEAEKEQLLAVLKNIAALGDAATPAFATVLPFVLRGYPLEAEAAKAVVSMIPEIVSHEFRAALASEEGQADAVSALEKIADWLAKWRDETHDRLVLVLRDELLPELRALVERAPRLRPGLAKTIGYFGAGDARAFSVLEAFVDDDNDWVREWTTHGLVHFGDRAVPLLVRLSKDSGGEIDRAAVFNLGVIGTPDAIAALTRLAKSGSARVKEPANNAIASIARRAERKAARAGATGATKAKQPAAKKKATKATKATKAKPAKSSTKVKAKATKAKPAKSSTKVKA